MLAEKNQRQELMTTTQNIQVYFFPFILKTVTVIICLKYSSTLITYTFDSRPPVFITMRNESFVLILKLLK